MKKTLLIIVAIFVSISSYCQSPGTALSSIAYTSALSDFSGKTYSPLSPFTVAQGGAILVANSSYTGTDYWDLSAYKGVELKLSCDAAYVGQYMAVRFVLVSASGAQSIIKTFTFTSTSQVVKLDFAADAAPTFKLWAIKMPWDGNITGSFPVTIDYLNAVSSFTTGMDEVKATADENDLVEVYDFTGRLLHKNVRRNEIVKSLKNGLYIVGNKKISINNH